MSEIYSDESVQSYNTYLKKLNDYIEQHKSVLEPYFLLTQEIKNISEKLVEKNELNGYYDLNIFIITKNGWTEKDIINKIFEGLTDENNQPTIGIAPNRQTSDMPGSFEFVKENEEVKIVYHNICFKK